MIAIPLHVHDAADPVVGNRLASRSHGRTERIEALELRALRELRHEVGNALTPACSYTQMLLARLPEWASESDRAALEAIRAGLARAAALLRASTAAPVVVGGFAHDEMPLAGDVRGLVEVALGQVPPNRRPDVRVVDRAGGALTGTWHRWHVLQILTNLLSNAAKYSKPGTPIRITVARAGKHARVTVADRGIGLRPAEREAIFSGHRTPEARRMASGNGIGLRLSRRLAESCGGTLSVARARRQGSAFTLRLPIEGGASGAAVPMAA